MGFLLIVGNNKLWLSFNLKNFLENIFNCFRKSWEIENKESKEARTRAKAMLQEFSGEVRGGRNGRSKDPRAVVAKWEGEDWEPGFSRSELSHTRWIDKDLL